MAPTTAVILAAGYGSRLGAPEGHKILAEIDGVPLFDWHVVAFARAGVREVIVVTGFKHEVLAEVLEDWPLPPDLTVRTVHNPEFELSNGVSILSAEPPTPFWLVMGDHLIDPTLFDRLPAAAADFAAAGLGGVLAIDHKLEAVFDMPDANKLRLADGRLDAIGKELDDFNCVDVGLFYCDQPFIDALRAELDERGDCNTSDAMRRLDASGIAGFWDVQDSWWQDVDTPGARAHAEELAAFTPGS